MILCPSFTLKGSWTQAETFFCVPMLGLDLHSSLHAQIACGNASEMVMMAGPSRCSALGWAAAHAAAAFGCSHSSVAWLQ